MLPECGFVRAVAEDGAEFSFRPSFGRIAALGTPQGIVELFADLHGPKASQAAAYVLAGLCDQEDVSPLIGEPVSTDAGVTFEGGQMPPTERIIIARHLMRHGIVGKAKPTQEGAGQFSESFEAAEYVAAASVHLGLSDHDAEGLSMTDFQKRLAMKFPDAFKPKRDVPSREAYEAALVRLKVGRRG